MSFLMPAEKMALTVARAQIERGDMPTPNVSAVIVLALARLEDLIGDLDVFIVCPDCNGQGEIWTMAANPTCDETRFDCTRCVEFGGMVRVYPEVGG